MTTPVHVDRTADERTMLVQMLDDYRATLLRKIHGLTDDQARTAAVPPSDLNLLGLVRHMADVERSWFGRRFAGQDLPPLFYGPSHPTGDEDGDLHPGPNDTVTAGVAALQSEITRARQIAAGSALTDLARKVDHGREFTLRWVYVHLIEEYARHCGHADLLRECIDGQTED